MNPTGNKGLMKRFYQTQWQGISFKDLPRLSTTEVAGKEFYNSFYHEVFRRYEGYDKLDTMWRYVKNEKADWIAKRLPLGSRVLSVGCGLGYIEHCLYQEHKQNFDLHVQDYASDALVWLSRELPASRIHLNAGVGCQTESGMFDYIYLSDVDYAVEETGMIDLLSDLKKKLRQSGTCLMISASFLEETPKFAERIKCRGKEAVKHVLERWGLYHRDQFWGWKRTRSEYRELMRKAGYLSISDGFIETPNQRSYFIEGRIVAV